MFALSPRTRDLVVLAAVALALRTAAALLVSHPPYTDPGYYTLVAQRLADGHGFSVPVLWSFLEVGGQLPADPMLPLPSNGHWMPLTSVVAAGSMLLFGRSWFAAEIPMILLSVGLVLLTYQIGAELWDRATARGGATLALFAGPLLLYSPMPNGVALFGTAAALSVYASLRAVRSARPGPWLVAAGLGVGLATLTRVDGLLVAVAPAVAWLLARGWNDVRPRLAWGVASAAAFAGVVAPWAVRDLTVFGKLLPSAGGHTLWISSYNQQFSIATDPSPATYLASGLSNIIGSKLTALVEIVGRTSVLMGGVFVLFLAVGLWRERRRELAPFTAYFATVVVLMVVVFTFHAPKGAFYHSSFAWLPVAAPLAVASLVPTARAAGRVWPFLRGSGAQRFLLIAGLAGAIVLSVAGSAALLVDWRLNETRLESAGAFLRANAQPGDRLLAYDPVRLYLLTGNPGVAPPFDPFPVVAHVVDAYHLRWVVVTLGTGETRDPLGLWDGASATDIDGNHPSFLPSDPAFEAPGVRIYAVVR